MNEKTNHGYTDGFPVAQLVNNPPAVGRVQSLGREDSETGMCTHCRSSALEKPPWRGAGWAAIHGVTETGR